MIEMLCFLLLDLFFQFWTKETWSHPHHNVTSDQRETIVNT
jgi:hypothetical protein